MPLSSLSKSIICMALALNLGACSYFLPNTTPTLGGLLAAKGDTRPFEVPLPINTEPKRMALGSMFTIGVKADGTVWSWGSGSSGELGRGDYNEHTNAPRIIPNMTDFIEVAAGSSHILALRKDGTVWSWGNNEKGQLGYKEDGHVEPNYYRAFQKVPKQIPDLKDIVSIAAGSEFSLAIDKSGSVYLWGATNTPKNQHANVISTPQKIYHHANAVRVVMVGEYRTVLMRDGKLKILMQPKGMWSDVTKLIPYETQLGIYQDEAVFELITPLPVVDVGSFFTSNYFLLNDGSVWALGGNRDGDLGQGDLRPHNGLLKVKNIGRIVDIASHTAAALDEKGKLWVWGGNIYWRPDLAGGNRSKEPYPIHISTKKPIKFIEGAFAIAMGMTNGEVYFMRQERVGIRGTGKPSPQDESTGHLLTPEKSLWTWK